MTYRDDWTRFLRLSSADGTIINSSTGAEVRDMDQSFEPRIAALGAARALVVWRQYVDPYIDKHPFFTHFAYPTYAVKACVVTGAEDAVAAGPVTDILVLEPTYDGVSVYSAWDLDYDNGGGLVPVGGDRFLDVRSTFDYGTGSTNGDVMRLVLLQVAGDAVTVIDTLDVTEGDDPHVDNNALWRATRIGTSDRVLVTKEIPSSDDLYAQVLDCSGGTLTFESEQSALADVNNHNMWIAPDGTRGFLFDEGDNVTNAHPWVPFTLDIDGVVTWGSRVDLVDGGDQLTPVSDGQTTAAGPNGGVLVTGWRYNAADQRDRFVRLFELDTDGSAMSLLAESAQGTLDRYYLGTGESGEGIIDAGYSSSDARYVAKGTDSDGRVAALHARTFDNGPTLSGLYFVQDVLGEPVKSELPSTSFVKLGLWDDDDWAIGMVVLPSGVMCVALNDISGAPGTGVDSPLAAIWFPAVEVAGRLKFRSSIDGALWVQVFTEAEVLERGGAGAGAGAQPTGDLFVLESNRLYRYSTETAVAGDFGLARIDETPDPVDDTSTDDPATLDTTMARSILVVPGTGDVIAGFLPVAPADPDHGGFGTRYPAGDLTSPQYGWGAGLGELQSGTLAAMCFDASTGRVVVVCRQAQQNADSTWSFVLECDPETGEVLANHVDTVTAEEIRHQSGMCCWDQATRTVYFVRDTGLGDTSGGGSDPDWAIWRYNLDTDTYESWIKYEDDTTPFSSAGLTPTYLGPHPTAADEIVVGDSDGGLWAYPRSLPAGQVDKLSDPVPVAWRMGYDTTPPGGGFPVFTIFSHLDAASENGPGSTYEDVPEVDGWAADRFGTWELDDENTQWGLSADGAQVYAITEFQRADPFAEQRTGIIVYDVASNTLLPFTDPEILTEFTDGSPFNPKPMDFAKLFCDWQAALSRRGSMKHRTLGGAMIHDGTFVRTTEEAPPDAPPGTFLPYDPRIAYASDGEPTLVGGDALARDGSDSTYAETVDPGTDPFGSVKFTLLGTVPDGLTTLATATVTVRASVAPGSSTGRTYVECSVDIDGTYDPYFFDTEFTAVGGSPDEYEMVVDLVAYGSDTLDPAAWAAGTVEIALLPWGNLDGVRIYELTVVIA